jgi:hypothetical protein
MFACRSAHNNPQSFSETLGMMPNFAGVEKFFAHMTFKASGAAGHSCRKQFTTRQILNAKTSEPGGGSRWKPKTGQSRITAYLWFPCRLAQPVRQCPADTQSQMTGTANHPQ